MQNTIQLLMRPTRRLIGLTPRHHLVYSWRYVRVHEIITNELSEQEIVISVVTYLWTSINGLP